MVAELLVDIADANTFSARSPLRGCCVYKFSFISIIFLLYHQQHKLLAPRLDNICMDCEYNQQDFYTKPVFPLLLVLHIRNFYGESKTLRFILFLLPGNCRWHHERNHHVNFGFLP